jgi:hypothetical protein
MLQMLQEDYGLEVMSRLTVFRWWKHFEEGGGEEEEEEREQCSW